MEGEHHRLPGGAFAAAFVLVALACVLRPSKPSPAEIALAEPCRYMGTVHKESRQRIEVLRACEAVSAEEWLCLARALERLDREFTARCKTAPVSYAEIAGRQRALHAACFGVPRDELVECSLLSTDERCLESCCGAP